jgi:hypothetical protein
MVTAVNVMDEKPVSNTLIQLVKEGSKVPEEGLIGEEGSFSFAVKHNGQHHISIHKAGF